MIISNYLRTFAIKNCAFVFFLQFFVGCQTTSYAPPPESAHVESVDVVVSDFHGRPDIYVDIKGRLSTNAAQLVDVEQSRGKGNRLIIDVREQTPRGGVSTNRLPSPPFQTRVPLEVLGLMPGREYIVDANGVTSSFRMPTGGADDSGYSSSPRH